MFLHFLINICIFLTSKYQKRSFPLKSSFLNDVKKCPILFNPGMQWRGRPQNGAFLVAILQELS